MFATTRYATHFRPKSVETFTVYYRLSDEWILEKYYKSVLNRIYNWFQY